MWFTSPSRREVVVGGTNRKFGRVVWVRSERRAGAVRCHAFALAEAWRREDQWYVMGERNRGRVRQVWEVRRRAGWPTVVRNVRVPWCRAEYVKSKDPVNASHWSQD
jgi:hypothetical protein